MQNFLKHYKYIFGVRPKAQIIAASSIGVLHQPEQVTKADHVGHVSRDRPRDAESPIFPWQQILLPWQQAPFPWQPRPEW